MTKTTLLLVSATIVLMRPAFAQCGEVGFLGNPPPGSVPLKGAMFDVFNPSAYPIVVRSFEQAFRTTGTASFEVWRTPPGTSFLGLENAAASWTLLGANPSLPHVATIEGPNWNLVDTGITVAVTIPPGGVQGFWLTCTNATSSLIYHSPWFAAPGTLLAHSGYADLRVGVGKAYPITAGTFGTSTLTRAWNGRVRYSQVFPDYDTNTPGAGLLVNGLQGRVCAPALSALCVGSTAAMTASTTQAGLPFEIVYNLADLVPFPYGGALSLSPACCGADTAVLNVNVAAGVSFMNGGAGPLFLPSPGFVSLVFPMPALPAPGLSAQYFQASATHPDGFELSQPVNLRGNPPSHTIAGPVGDDSAVSLSVGTPAGGCSAFVAPPISLYGVLHTQYHVISNGRVVMGPLANLSFSPAQTYPSSEAPFAGIHTNLNPERGGSITIDDLGGALNVHYNGVAYRNSPAFTSVTYTVSLNAASQVVFSNVNLGVPTYFTDVLLGVHPGGAVTIEPGFPASYAGAGTFQSTLPGHSHNATADLFSATLTDPADNLTFTYNGAGGYHVSY